MSSTPVDGAHVSIVTFVFFVEALACWGSVLHGVIVASPRLNVQKQAMAGYTPDEKLRFDQLVKLRRQWLKDQELSPREPVIEAKPPGPIAKFWTSFLEPKSLWRLYVSTANGSYMLAKQQSSVCK